MPPSRRRRPPPPVPNCSCIDIKMRERQDTVSVIKKGDGAGNAVTGMSSAHGSSHPTVALSTLLSPKIQIVQDSEEKEASFQGACRQSYRGKWRRKQRSRGAEEQELLKAKEMEKSKEKEEILSSSFVIFSFAFSFSFYLLWL